MSPELVAISLKNGFPVIQCEGFREKDIRLEKNKKNDFEIKKPTVSDWLFNYFFVVNLFGANIGTRRDAKCRIG